MDRRGTIGEIRLPQREEPVAPVTIFDGNGSVLRVVPAAEFRRAAAAAPPIHFGRRARAPRA